MTRDEDESKDAHTSGESNADGGRPSELSKLPQGQGVHDEPNIFPANPETVLKYDYCCSKCGYNLRGLPVGRACPECGARFGDAPGLDSSEAKAGGVLAREAKVSERTYRDGQSIHDEPDIFPGRGEETIEQDWSCSQCGYNLRGLPVGHRCPECGHIELYRPAPESAESYGAWLERRLQATSARTGWRLAVMAALIGGPLGVLGALLESLQTGLPGIGMALVLTIVFGPAVEEIIKIATASLIVETRPYLFKRVEQIQFAAIGSALIFATLENLIYLKVYIANPTVTIYLWRWTVCVALHAGCTAIAARGLITVWQKVMTEKRAPRLAAAMPWLVTAILVHGLYNATMIGIEYVFPFR